MNDYPQPYPGDNENSAWVRMMMEKKGYKVDHRQIIMRLPKTSIDILFFNTIRREFPDYV